MGSVVLPAAVALVERLIVDATRGGCHGLPAPAIRTRTAIRDYSLSLDPVADHQQICFLSTCYAFAWDYTRALELALFRTFGIAS